MAQAITCDTIGISTTELERGSYVLLDDGTYAKRIVLVDGGEALSCVTSGTSGVTMQRGSYAVIGVGQYAQQVIDVS